MKKTRILVMDDDEAVRSVLTRMIVHLGHEVEVVDEGEKAVNTYRESKEAGKAFDMIIMDLVVLEGMDGREALEKIISFDPRARAVVSSGYTNGPVMTDFEKFGFRGVLHKPFRMAELSRTITMVLAE